MCKFSMKDKKCPYMGPGKRCKGGYHLRGTVPATSNGETLTNPASDAQNRDAVPLEQIPQTNSQQNQGGNIIIDPSNLKDFLGKLIREELAAAMTQQRAPTQAQQPQPPQPQPTQPQPPTQQLQPPQQQQPRFQSSQDYRLALIGELLSKH